jgi:hypothetical protein
MGCGCLGSVEEQASIGIYDHYSRTVGVLRFHRVDVDFLGAPAIAHYGRDTALVLILPATGRHHRLLSMEIQVDPVFLYGVGTGIHLREPAKA